MTPRAKRTLAAFRRQLGSNRITIRRGTGPSASSCEVRGRVTGYQPDELIGDIDQGSRKVIVLAEDVSLDAGVRNGDRIVWSGAPLIVEAVDDATGNIDGSLVALYLRVKG